MTPAPLVATAQPFEFSFHLASSALVIIDMQRDFIEPGGFGESLGNNVALLSAIVPACQAVLAGWRGAGGLVVHTREAHRADLLDCPPAKRNRGNPGQWGVFWSWANRATRSFPRSLRWRARS